MSSRAGVDSYAFVLALILIGAFVLFYGIILWIDKTPGFEGLKTVSSTLGNIVAAIVGYYFGQRPVQSANERVQETRDLLRRDVTNTLSETDADQKTYEQMKRELESIKTQLGELS